MDDNVFFREATKKICSSLNIATAMENCFEFLQDHIPADGINLGWFDPERGGLQLVARIGLFSSLDINDGFMPVPEETWEAFKWKEDDNIRLFNDPESHVIPKNFTRIFGIKDISAMALRLTVEGNKVGIFGVVAKGRGRFEPRHKNLLRLLHDPVAIAMSNAQKHMEVVKLMDLLADDNRYLRQEMLESTGSNIIGTDMGLKGIMEMVRQVAPLNSPVLILGETGTGKELVANAIHMLSARNASPFIKVNCGAIPQNLIDSELFGHEKGAFTGAASRKRGRFERAHTGTILLDEIGELTLEAQVRLLRVLQNKEIERVGGTESITVDSRIITSTNRNLEVMVKEGTFREDLWFRLNVFPITIPPLRERREDIPALLNHFIQIKSREFLYKIPPPISPGSLELLMDYSWPGNVRELENMVERVLIHFRGKEKPEFLDFKPFVHALKNVVIQKDVTESNGPDRLDDVDRIHIRNILARTNGKVHGPGGAAELLGINANTLRSKMDRLDIHFGKRRKKQAYPEK